MKRLTYGQHVVDWVAKKTNEFGSFGTNIGIGLQVFRGPHWETIAGVAYANWNGPNIECHIASDGSKKWLTREYLWKIFDYPFNQVKVKRITVLVGEGNLPSRKFVEHLGFTLETTLGPDSHPTGRLLVYRMYRQECRWIGLDSKKLFAKAA